MRRPPGHSPSSYNMLDSYNSTRGAGLSTQTCLRDPHSNPSESGHIGVSGEAGQGQGQRLELQAGAQCM